VLRLIVGEEAFFAGMNRYFDNFDGTAATVEDFVGSFQASTAQDLSAFAQWYAQAGTPLVRAWATTMPPHAPEPHPHADNASTPGQPVKAPLRIRSRRPVRL
jgi:aminopeptidase N